METNTRKDEFPGLPPGALALRAEMASGRMRRIKSFSISEDTVEVCQGDDSVWVVAKRGKSGGFALRTAYSPGASLPVEVQEEMPQCAEFRVLSPLGEFRVRVFVPDAKRPLLQCTTRLTPSADLLIPFWPRDVYPLDAHGDPAAAKGIVHAAQRGYNSGLVYLTLAEPRFGSLLYFQNLTALNDYFQKTDTLPDGRVGGQWPELGYAPPPSEEKPLPAGREIVISDVFLHWSEEVPQDHRQSARLFLDLLAGVYERLDRPRSEFHDWPSRAKQTLRDLERSPKATIKHYGHTYLHPYTDAEYPDSMVQLTTLMPIRDYAAWRGRSVPFAEELRAGVPRFFDAKLGSLRRYLPNVGKDKNADEVDSWYLYHPLANLGRLAMAGDQNARALFFQSLDYGIKVARHFHYLWPVQFDVQTLDVIKGERKPGEPGQSDAGGLYAYVMIQAWEISAEERYLNEAQKAIRALKGKDFNLDYQANITAWGANACLRLWRITGEEFYREQSYVFLASFFHNTLLWESQIRAAQRYPVFLGVTCLHDGPYMALYECFESYAAFHEYLDQGQEHLPASVRLLLTEFCKYTLTRAWYAYPEELPEEILATEVRNGHIDRTLAFPLEDLYADGQPAGQVGQEIYGCGAAFAFVTRAYHPLKNAPFQLYCEYPLGEWEETAEPCVSFQVRGLAGFACRTRLIPTSHEPLPRIHVRDESGRAIRGHQTDEGHWEFSVSGESRVELGWEKK